MTEGDRLLDEASLGRTLRRLAHAILEATSGADSLALIGVRRGGVPIAERLAQEMKAVEQREVPVGAVDIALYRDDAASRGADPKIGPSDISFAVDGRDVVLVDDVLQTGRTIRAAIDCVLDYGRPRRIWLAVLFDRGGRDLPIQPDFVGKRIEVPPDARIFVEIGDSTARALVRRSST